jgi:hypothetical protein
MTEFLDFAGLLTIQVRVAQVMAEELLGFLEKGSGEVQQLVILKFLTS